VISIAMANKYDKHIKPKLDDIRVWRANGMKLDDIAKRFPVHRATFYEYIKKFSDLSDALKKAESALHEKMISQAETSLFDKLEDRWMEYERVTERIIDRDGKETERITTKERLILADTAAIIYTLKARLPGIWNEDDHKFSKAKLEKILAEIERIGKGEDIGQLIMERLNGYASEE
jgi:predicted DNA-binding protein YlxM (UPF0122 family)